MVTMMVGGDSEGLSEEQQKDRESEAALASWLSWLMALPWACHCLRTARVRLFHELPMSNVDSQYRACLLQLGGQAGLGLFSPWVSGQPHCPRSDRTVLELPRASCSAPLPFLFFALLSAPYWRRTLQMSVKPLDAASRSGVAPLGVAASSCARASNNASTT